MKIDIDSTKNLVIATEDATKNIADFISKLPEIELNRDLYRVIANPVDTGRLRDSIKADDKTYNRTGKLAEIPIIESSFVKAGTAYLVPEHHTAFNPTYKPSPLPDNFALQDYQRKFIAQITSAFGVPSRYLNEQPHIPTWQRLGGESLVEWGNRLEKMGLFDNPEYRWEYQKVVLNTVFVVPVQVLINKIKEVLHE